MLRIAGEIVIDRPVDEVFDFVADERNEPDDNPRMLRAESPPREGRPGATRRQETRSPIRRA